MGLIEKKFQARKLCKDNGRFKLDPQYVPKHLPEREEEIEEVIDLLMPVLRDASPSHGIIYGKTGVGKTAVVKYTLENEIKSFVKKRDLPVLTHIINCAQVNTKMGILENLVSTFGGERSKVYSAYARLNDLIDLLNSLEKHLILVLDEIDKIKQEHMDILYTFTRLVEQGHLVNSSISIIGISNSTEFVQNLDPRIRSSLGTRQLIMPPYDAVQLGKILTERVKEALKPGVIDQGAISLIAALSAQEHGDAREALDLLRLTVDIAESKGLDMITEDTVHEAYARYEMDVVEEIILNQPLQSQVIFFTLAALEKKGIKKVYTGMLYNAYREFCKGAKIMPLGSRRVRDLLHELEMLGAVSAAKAYQGRYGITTHFNLTIPLNRVDILLQKSKISDFASYLKFEKFKSLEEFT